MSKLTLKQENFCQAYLRTGNASEAYRQAYNVGKDTKEATINRTAKELMDTPKIAARIEELRRPALLATQLTVESHLAELALLRDAAVYTGHMGAAVTAEVKRGEVAGFYIERKEIRTSRLEELTPEECDQIERAVEDYLGPTRGLSAGSRSVQ